MHSSHREVCVDPDDAVDDVGIWHVHLDPDFDLLSLANHHPSGIRVVCLAAAGYRKFERDGSEDRVVSELAALYFGNGVVFDVLRAIEAEQSIRSFCQASANDVGIWDA